MGKIGLISYPESGPIGKLADLFATFAASVNQALPVKFVSTLSALNAISMGSALLPGTLAMLAADDSGLAAGAQFSMHPDGKWRLIGSCTALDINTFVTSLTTLTKIKTLPGATCWNSATSAMFAFTATSGAHTAVNATKVPQHGSGVTASAIAVGTTLRIPVAFAANAFDAAPSNILVTCGNTRVTCGGITPTKTGFSLQLSNWSNAAMAGGQTYAWTAFA